MSRAEPSKASLELLLRTLKLPGFVAHHEEVAKAAEKEGWSFATSSCAKSRPT